MATPTTEKFEELIVDVEFTASSGVYTSICGLVDATITRTANIDSTEVPDCDDESAPLSMKKDVRSVEVSVSGTGVWAASSQSLLKEWFYSGVKKNVRIRDTAAATNDVEIESGPAILSSFPTARTKGQQVSAEVEIQFDGTPSRTDAS